jgi:8-oxo-dGTP pyrophosphatase MutT (NUDIX family)
MPSYYRDPSAPSPNVARRIGVIALIEREGALLVQRRADDGAWDFLGGTLEEDESVMNALEREVREETGLEIAGATLLGLFSDPTRIVRYPDGTTCRLLSIAFCVRVDADAAPKRSSESLELRFFAAEELADLDLWPVSRPVLDAYFATRDGVIVA